MSVNAFLQAGTVANIEGEVIQLGTGRTVSVEELFRLSCRILGVAASVIRDPRRLRPDASEVLVLQSDPKRAKERLGWKPAVALEEGLQHTCVLATGKP